MYTAIHGNGAYCNGEKIRVGNRTEISEGSIQTDNSYSPEKTKDILDTLAKISPLPWVLIRGSAILGMCAVADGQVDAYFHKDLKPWDNAAAHLIIREAGGKVVNHKGEKAQFTDSDIIAGNSTVVSQILELIHS